MFASVDIFARKEKFVGGTTKRSWFCAQLSGEQTRLGLVRLEARSEGHESGKREQLAVGGPQE